MIESLDSAKRHSSTQTHLLIEIFHRFSCTKTEKRKRCKNLSTFSLVSAHFPEYGINLTCHWAITTSTPKLKEDFLRR